MVTRSLVLPVVCLLIIASSLTVGLTRADEPIDPTGVEPLDAGPSEPLPGEREVRALFEAYLTRIDAVEPRGGEWALLMDGTWYTWASGRLLPEDLQDEWESFVPILFYRYQLGPLPEPEYTPEMEDRFRARTDERTNGSTDSRQRFNGFLDALYQIGSERDAERIVRVVSFLGFRTRVHPLLIEPLERVERTIRARTPGDPRLAAFVESLASIHGYNWRSIAGTLRRSYHSYGVAIDLTPRSYRGTWPYWLWAAEAGIDEWWRLPLGSRWQVPQPVIDAFEEEGFIWGGKWTFFDNLHFEFRPESILMAGF